MANTLRCSIAVGTLTLLGMALACVGEPPAQAQEYTGAVDRGAVVGPLSVEQVVEGLQQNNRERAEALHRVEGMRVYSLHYHGALGDRDAEMVVKVEYQAPGTRQFTVISQSGSKFLCDHILKKLLEGEQEALRLENQKAIALNTENYVFALAGYEETPEGARYILSVMPKSKNKFVYRGKVWIDAADFAVVRIVAEPAKSPSFWVKKSVIEHNYAKVNNFWFPTHSRTESATRLSGLAVLSIEYKDYKIIEAGPITAFRIQ